MTYSTSSSQMQPIVLWYTSKYKYWSQSLGDLWETKKVLLAKSRMNRISHNFFSLNKFWFLFVILINSSHYLLPLATVLWVSYENAYCTSFHRKYLVRRKGSRDRKPSRTSPCWNQSKHFNVNHGLFQHNNEIDITPRKKPKLEDSYSTDMSCLQSHHEEEKSKSTATTKLIWTTSNQSLVVVSVSFLTTVRPLWCSEMPCYRSLETSERFNARATGKCGANNFWWGAGKCSLQYLLQGSSSVSRESYQKSIHWTLGRNVSICKVSNWWLE